MFRRVVAHPRVGSFVMTAWSLSYCAWPFIGSSLGYNVGQLMAGAGLWSLVGVGLASALVALQPEDHGA